MFSSIPIASPTAAAIQNDVKRANSAAVSAGTTWSGSDVESSCVIEAASTPSPPATTVASTVFASASWFGERPSSIAPTSFSEAARVASPKRLSRNRSESTSVAGEDDRRQDEPVDRNDRAEHLTVPRGSTGGCGLVAIPNASETPACATSRTPSEAASLASGEAVRSGRNATNSITTPSTTRNSERDHQRRRRRRVPAVDAGLERPVRVAAEHRDRRRSRG